jgi:hypothetical protein
LWLGSEHRSSDQSKAAPYGAQSHSFKFGGKLKHLADLFVTLDSGLLSRIVMRTVLTKLARAGLALAEITVAVTIIALLAATAVPGFFVRQHVGTQPR